MSEEICSILRNELEFDIVCQILINTYVDTRETNIDGVWVHCGPETISYDIQSIIGFREQNEDDKHHDWVYSISDSTKMPTEWCMMEYREEGKRNIQVIPVVGTVESLTKKYNEAYMEYAKKRRKMYENIGNLRQYFESLL